MDYAPPIEFLGPGRHSILHRRVVSIGESVRPRSAIRLCIKRQVGYRPGVIPRRDKAVWRWLVCSLAGCCVCAPRAWPDVVLRSLPVSCAPVGDGLGRFHAGRFHWTLEGAATADRLGVMLPRLADANGDGRREFVVAARRSEETQSAHGRVWALSWDSAEDNPNVLWSWSGDRFMRQTDWTLAGGDFNGDGFTDLLFGVRTLTAVHLFEGSIQGWPSVPRLILENGSRAGRTLLVRDVNRDGFADLFIGISGWNQTRGNVELYLGSVKGLAETPAWHCDGRGPGDGFGGNLAVLDANGDGRLDLVVAQRFGVNTRGYVRLYLGTDSFFATEPAWSFDGPVPASSFGYCLSVLGDLNKDGRQELAVGAPGFRSSNGWPGMAFVFYGSPMGLEPQPAWTATGTGSNSWFGRSVRGVGDIDGDGWPDLAIGMPGQEQDTNHAGCVRLYLGGAKGLATNASWSAYASHARTSTGEDIAALGDVNGDGLPDFAVASPTWSSTESAYQRIGRVDIFLGHTNAYSQGSGFRPDGTNALAPSEHAHYLLGKDLQIDARARADRLTLLLGEQERAYQRETNQLASRLNETEQRSQVETNRLASVAAQKERERLATATRMKRLGLSLAIALPAVAATAAMLWMRQRRRVARASAERERERFARDLHDGLGSGVHRMQRLTELLDGQDPASDEARKYREDLRRTSQELGGTLDDAIWAVKPENDTLENLVDFLANQAPSILEPHGVSCELDLPELPAVTLTGDTRQHIVLAVKEGLNNVAKHAKASRAWLRVAWSAPWLEIVVEDDGCGMQSSAPRPNGLIGGNGLRNLQGRMQAMGGTSIVTTRESGGTRLVLRVPLPRAG